MRGNVIRAGGLAAGFAAGMLFYAATRHGAGDRSTVPGPVASEAPAPVETPAAARRSAPSPAAFPVPEALPAGWDASLGAAPRFDDVTDAAGITFRHCNG